MAENYLLALSARLAALPTKGVVTTDLSAVAAAIRDACRAKDAILAVDPHYADETLICGGEQPSGAAWLKCHRAALENYLKEGKSPPQDGKSLLVSLPKHFAAQAPFARLFDNAAAVVIEGETTASADELAPLVALSLEIVAQAQRLLTLAGAVHDLKHHLLLLQEQLAAAKVALPESAASSLERAVGLTGGALSVVFSTPRGAAGAEERMPRCDLNSLLSAEVQRLAGRLARAGMSLDLQLHADALLVAGEQFAFENAIFNILDNALRYGARGGRIVVRSFPRQGRALARIGDNGSGIPEHDRPFVFTPLVRGGSAPSSGGTGIGLAAARTALERHGGTLVLLPPGADDPALSTVFELSIPLADA